MSRRQRPKPGRVQAPVPLAGTIVNTGSDDRRENVRKVERCVAAYLDDLPPGTRVQDIDRGAMADWLYLVIRAALT